MFVGTEWKICALFYIKYYWVVTKEMADFLKESKFFSLARTPEIGQGLGRILSCGARKPEQT